MKVLLRIRVPEFDKTKCESRVKNILLFVFILYQDEADIIYSLSTGDVHFCGNVKGIKECELPVEVLRPRCRREACSWHMEKGSEVAD